MQEFIQKRFDAWLDRRIPPVKETVLNQRRIFIFPSWHGLSFFLVVFVLLLVSINYQNNLAFILTFFLISIFNTAIIFTYINFSGLELKSGRAHSTFAGDFAEFEVILKRQPRSRHRAIYFYWPGNPSQVHYLDDSDTLTIKLHAKAEKRGYFNPGRLKIESFYPLGLIRCWSWVDLDFETIIYPKPITLKELPMTHVDGSSGIESRSLGQEDFSGFKNYEPGESLRHVDWRGYARGQDLQSKVYVSRQDELNWVDWFALEGMPTELRLSKMCDWVLRLDKADKPYGLRLPNEEVAPSKGEKHKKEILTRLALFGFSKD